MMQWQIQQVVASTAVRAAMYTYVKLQVRICSVRT